MRPERALLAWSSGKDSAFSLHVLREQGVAVTGLLTTINDAFDRVAMHAVRLELLRAQADAVGLPLVEVRIPWPCPNEAYEAAMAEALAAARERGTTAVAFGDLFLEDVRRYREERMSGTGLVPLFPLWGRPTRALAEEMIASAAGRPHLRRPARAAARVRRPRLRRGAPARVARRGRSLRRARRVPQLRLGRPGVPAPGPGAGGRGRGPRRLRLRGPLARGRGLGDEVSPGPGKAARQCA